MSDEGKILMLREELRRISNQLTQWAAQSSVGGWSTHQVDPMLRKANEINVVLEKTR